MVNEVTSAAKQKCSLQDLDPPVGNVTTAGISFFLFFKVAVIENVKGFSPDQQEQGLKFQPPT